ncbi:hypothetical protein GIW81_06200 [Hyphomicrobium sp. xq]|uniref:HEPN domain-containing protein n=1 Tax=Hyphomicrobium album TaxID=2665159 RepID=A0A6I3KIP4_9HYPH|nr:hypothetical protein [Hyphomicrobium album]MTD93926.1 hypothetical protein [Hyphomicrobium album]
MTKATFKENTLFRGWKAHSAMNACVGNNGGPYDLYDYAQGYFEATRLLLQEAQKPGIIIDVVVYPICLTYRHAMELFIKYLISDLAKLNNAKKSYRPNHGLKENWELALKLIAEAKLKASDRELAAIGEVVEAMAEVDPKGEIFRYPESIKGDQHLKDWSLINLVVLERSAAKTFEIAHTLHHRLETRLGR